MATVKRDVEAAQQAVIYMKSYMLFTRYYERKVAAATEALVFAHGHRESDKLEALKLADLVEQCRTQSNGGGKAVADEIGAHKDSVDLLIEVCSQIQALCSELVSDKPDAVVVRLAFDVAEDALCDFESIESDVSRLLDAPKGESEPVAPRAASPVRALVDRVASLYSGKALPNDPTELRITGHDVYLAQQAQAELGGGV